MLEYQHLLQEGKSSGAVKVLGLDKIKMLQAADTRNVRKGVLSFIDHKVKPVSIGDIASFIAKSCNNYGIALGKPSPRSLMKIIHSGNHNITVVTDLKNYGETGLGRRKVIKTMDLPYLEPRMSTMLKTDKLIFESEQTRDNNIPFRLVRVISSIVRRNPSISQALSLICAIMGYAVPVLINSESSSTDRVRMFKSKPDITLNIPPIHKARSTVLMRNEIRGLYTSSYDMDRTSLEYFSDVASYMEISALGSYRNEGSCKKNIVNIKILKPELIMSTDEMLQLYPLPDIKYNIPRNERVMIELRIAHEREMSEMRRINSATDMSTKDSTELDVLLEYYAEKILKKIKYVMSGFYQHDDLPSIITETTSLNYNREIYRKVMIKLIRLNGYKNLDNENVKEADNEFEDAKSKVYEKLFVIKHMLPNVLLEPDIMVSITRMEVLNYIGISDLVSTLFNKERIMVIDSGLVHGRDPVANTVKNIIRKTISQIYDECYDHGWDHSYKVVDGVLLRSANEKIIKIDSLLDMLSVAYDSVRRSIHRNQFYNKTTFEIIYYKLLIASTIGFCDVGEAESDDEYYDDVVDDDDIISQGAATNIKIIPSGSYFLTVNQIEYFISQHKTIEKRDLGPDHIKLLSAPLPHRSCLRAEIYRNNKKIRRPLGSIEELYLLARTEQHYFSNILARIISSSVTTIDRRSLTDTDVDYIKLIGTLPPPRNPSTYTYGREDHKNYYTIQSMWANLLLLMRSEGFNSIKLIDSVPVDMINTMNREILTSERSIPVNYRITEQNSISLVHEVFSDPISAVSSYANISSLGPNFLSLLASDNYYVVAGAVLIEIDNVKESEPSEDFINLSQALSLFPSSLNDHLNSLLSASGSYAHFRRHASTSMPNIKIGNLTICQTARNPQVIKEAPMIVAASVLSSSSCTISQALWSWYLLDGFLKGISLEGIRESYEKDIISYDNADKRGKRMMIAALKANASSVRMYFLINPVSSSMSMDISDYLNYPDDSVLGLGSQLTSYYVKADTLSIKQLISLGSRLGDDDDSNEVIFPSVENIDMINDILPGHLQLEDRRK